MGEKRYYELVNEKNEQIGYKEGVEKSIFTGSAPRQAALKAATRGVEKIRLRERGRRNKNKTISIHVFKGSVKVVAKPEKAPEQLPDKIKLPSVEKVKVDHLKI